MNFIQAIKALQEGKLVYRKSYDFKHWWSSNAGCDWSGDLIIYFNNGIIKFKVDLKRLWRQTPYLLAKNITCQRLKVFLSGFLFVYLLKKQEVAFLNILKPHMIYPFQIWYVKC